MSSPLLPSDPTPRLQGKKIEYWRDKGLTPSGCFQAATLMRKALREDKLDKAWEVYVWAKNHEPSEGFEVVEALAELVHNAMSSRELPFFVENTKKPLLPSPPELVKLVPSPKSFSVEKGKRWEEFRPPPLDLKLEEVAPKTARVAQSRVE